MIRHAITRFRQSHPPRMTHLVPTMRLELIRPRSLPPQDSVSTNFTTSALLQSGRTTGHARNARPLPCIRTTLESPATSNPNPPGSLPYPHPQQQAAEQAVGKQVAEQVADIVQVAVVELAVHLFYPQVKN